MILLHPIWLVLAIPLGVLLWLWPLPGRWLRLLRTATFVLLLLALAGWAVQLPQRAGTVVVLVDRSFSVPNSEKDGLAVIELIQKEMRPEEQLGVLSFGRNVLVERPPQRGPFSGFTGEIDRDSSALTEALEKGLALIPRQSHGRLLVLSDGRWTGKEPTGVASQAAARGIAIDYRLLERPQTNDVAIVRVEAPSVVDPGEAFLLHAWVQAPTQQKVTFELWRGTERIAHGTRTLGAKLNRLTFRDLAEDTGVHAYRLKIEGASADPMPENNQARFLVRIEGARPLLVVTRSRASGLVRALQASQLRIRVQAPEQCTWSLEELSQYSGVVLEEVPADQIGTAGMETLAAWVQKTGTGLLMTGGPNAYGPGGYYRSPLEPIMPVSMELRQEHRKLALAIVVALDRSGSMAMPVDHGRVKMDLANLGAAQVLDLLNPGDEFGVLAVDSAPHLIQGLAPPVSKEPIRQRILSIRSQGGGIFVYVALEQAYRMLQAATAGNRHIILFSDAADSEEPGAYQGLLARCRDEGITVSVIGLGQRTDKDGVLLEDIARLGKGRCFFTNSPEELPRLFAQDTFVVARSSFLKEATPVQLTAGLAAVAGEQSFGKPSPIGGYNLCYLRPEATLAGVTQDEFKAPLIASWQAGAGRVMCYTGQADGSYTGAIGNWQHYGDLMSSLARWTAGPPQRLPDSLLLTQEVKGGQAVVTLHLDPERRQEPFTGIPTVTTLRAQPDKKPQVETRPLPWTAADTLSVAVPLLATETTLTSVQIPGHDPVTLAPVCLPYSPEYRPLIDGRSGQASLEQLARATGGQERLNVAEIWRDIPQQPRLWEPTPWLLLLAVLLLLLEVLERRTGVLSAATHIPGGLRRWLGLRSRRTISARTPLPPVAAQPLPAAAATGPAPTAAEHRAEPPQPAPPEKVKDDLLDALRQAQRRSRGH